MRPGLVWLVGFAVPMLAGLPLAFARPFGWLSLPARMALAGAIGWFSTSLAMTAASLFGVPWSAPWMIAGGLGITSWLSRGLGREKPIRLVETGTSSWVRVAGWLLSSGAVAAAILAVVAGAATSGDLIVFWGAKSEAFALARGIDTGFLKTSALQYLHISYPPLLTNVYALATIVAGRFSWLAATATFPLLLAVLAVALTGILRWTTDANRASLAAAVAVCGLGLLGNEADVAGNGEMALLLFESLAMALLISPMMTTASVQRLAGCLLGGAACTKVEGLPFVVAAIVLFVVLSRRRIDLARALVRLAGPTMIGLAVWFLLGAGRRVFVGYEGYGSLHVLYVRNLGVVLGDVGRALWLVGYGLPFLVPIVLLLLVRRRVPPMAWLPLGTAAALALFFVFTYLHEPDPGLWIGWSAARIFSPLVPLVTLACVSAAEGAGHERIPPGQFVGEERRAWRPRLESPR